MSTVRFELLRPKEILDEKRRCSIVYLPIGPLEWHGPHMALGMDPLNAEAVSRRVAETVGGVVMPTLDNRLLPPQGEPLYNVDWAIVDDKTFRGFPNSSFTVRDDPREADAALGKRIMDKSVETIFEIIRNKYDEMK